jgi:hypothetical protein
MLSPRGDLPRKLVGGYERRRPGADRGYLADTACNRLPGQLPDRWVAAHGRLAIRHSSTRTRPQSGFFIPPVAKGRVPKRPER